MVKRILYKTIERFIGKMSSVGLFNSIVQIAKKKDLVTRQGNIILAENMSIDDSANILTFEEGKVSFEGNNYVGRNCEIGTKKNISIGYNSSIQDRCVILGEVQIGRHCLFAPNVYLSSGIHNYANEPYLYIKDQDRLSDERGDRHSKKVIIEDDVWLGINVVVMDGVTIGKGSVVGANSVVTKNIEQYSIVAGSPAKLIKKRLNFEPKNFLSYSKITDSPYFYSGVCCEKSDIDRAKSIGGLETYSSFILCLCPSKFITIVVENTSTKELAIVYESQEKMVRPKTKIKLQYLCSEKEFHTFKITKEDMKGLLLIKSACTHED